jgi:hypothetical protein
MPHRAPPHPAPPCRQARAPRGLVRGLSSVLLLMAASCARFGYDLMDAPASGLGSFDGLVTSADAAGTLGLRDAGSAGGATPGSLDAASSALGELPPSRGGDAGDGAGISGAGGATGFDAGGSVGPSGGSAGVGVPDSRECVLRGTETLVEQFDSSSPLVEARGANSSVTWTGTVGNPSPGALEFDVPSGSSAELYSANLTGNLSGRRMLLNVYVVSGTNVRMRLFVETANPARRGYGTYVSSPLASWDCASLDLQAPATSDTGFDPSNVSGAGLEVEGSGDVAIYVDQFAY